MKVKVRKVRKKHLFTQAQSVSKTELNIDYDKIAEAIVKAHESQSQKYSISREWMKFIITPVFWGFAVISGLLAVAFLIYGGGAFASELGSLPNTDWSRCVGGFVSLCASFFMISICLSSFFAAKEIDKETDRQYSATIFSNIVALVALAVALISLMRR